MTKRVAPERLRTWLCEPPPRDVVVSLDRLAGGADVVRVAVMPDVHLAEEVCVGVALATRRLIYPCAVGADIGCGMLALAFRGPTVDERSAPRVLAGLAARIPSLKQPAERVVDSLPKGLDELGLSAPRLVAAGEREGRHQLGTLGRGNHFVELQSDDEERLWLMIHSGSRGMGRAISEHHRRQERRGVGGLGLLDADSDEGRAYLLDAAWAERYAAANRRVMAEAVAAVLAETIGACADWETLRDSSHNHVRRERFEGEPVWTHRKGALRAELDEPGVIPGSMGTRSHHVRGRGHEPALWSSSHGAGRRLSRDAARRSIGAAALERELRGVWFDRRRAAQLRDEAPSAYKDLGRVMRAQRELTRIERTLRPLLVYKG